MCAELSSNAVVGSLSVRLIRGCEPHVLSVEDPVPNSGGVRFIRGGIGATCEADEVSSAFDELKITNEGVASFRGMSTRDSTK